MRPQRPYVVEPDEVVVTRDGEMAIIEYKKENFGTTHLTIDPEIHNMSDEDIICCYNGCLYAQDELKRNDKYIATEIPVGKPQTEYSNTYCHWTMRGNILRCAISWKDNETTVLIDDKEFTMKQFGEMLSAYDGWGMRIIMVPEDEIHQTPPIMVKDPEEDENAILLAEEFGVHE
ncbi:conserved hypothetical protein [Gammaproteobacteria bacterium]